MNRTYELPMDLEESIEDQLKKIGHTLENPRKLAVCVRELSDFYIHNPQKQTPWNENWALAAYLCYYLPLNALRAWSVVDEGHRHQFFDGLHSLVDFGSGLGAGSWWLSEIDHQIFVERSKLAQDIHKGLITDIAYKSWHNEIPAHIPQKALGVFSYSLTELKSPPNWIFDFDALMIIEPATKSDGRNLLELRHNLIHQGYEIIAPCTHQGKCPLLKDSETDWCHDRIHFRAPDWFREMESQLPFKNQTLTMSYLLARKVSTIKSRVKPSPALPIARIVGDRQDEKGKSRQLVCRNEEREFLAWLHRDGPPQTILRGAQIEFPQNFEKKSNEIRLISPVKVLEI